MTTTTPSPSDFLAMPSDPDEGDYDVEPFEPGAANPLESIAVSLQRLADIAERDAPEPVTGIVTQEEFDELARAYDDLEAKQQALNGLVDQVLEIVKPSTSKVSLSVKDAIEQWRNPTVPPDPMPVPEVTPEQAAAAFRPDHDADVEEWRAYARSRGYQGADVDTMNRSQIRTMLGIEQPQSDG